MPLVWHLRDRVADDYLSRSATRVLRRAIPRLARGILANSQATLETLGPVSSRPAWVVPDAVEAPPVRAHARRGAHGEATAFGMLGRIAPWKGQDLFLRAFADAFPAGSERAVIIGTPMFGEEDFEASLRKLALELGLAARVEFRGFREDIWRELASLDVLVHASLIPEPFGQVVLEGMAAGLPVLAPDEGGPAEVIEDGRTGVLFASRDERALAAAMRALDADAERRGRLGAAAREAAARRTAPRCSRSATSRPTRRCSAPALRAERPGGTTAPARLGSSSPNGARRAPRAACSSSPPRMPKRDADGMQLSGCVLALRPMTSTRSWTTLPCRLTGAIMLAALALAWAAAPAGARRNVNLSPPSSAGETVPASDIPSRPAKPQPAQARKRRRPRNPRRSCATPAARAAA